jgi:hypothetical protein
MDETLRWTLLPRKSAGSETRCLIIYILDIGYIKRLAKSNARTYIIMYKANMPSHWPDTIKFWCSIPINTPRYQGSTVQMSRL